MTQVQLRMDGWRRERSVEDDGSVRWKVDGGNKTIMMMMMNMMKRLTTSLPTLP